MDPFEDILKRAEKDALDNLHNDAGHIKLLADLTSLLLEAKDLEFHDMLNTKYATPKVELAAKLEVLRQGVISGAYDN